MPWTVNMRYVIPNSNNVPHKGIVGMTHQQSGIFPWSIIYSDPFQGHIDNDITEYLTIN